ncbi:hypothetical protein DSM106972_029710 [Dulcicalothrix desertica PCC 7102]|uniref:coproporphyrinogen oxidase n=1 Tax=Dulcicalothrix desertica PCC 7102 TaxID=232991 RepID=A0A3S1J2W7_9CYAN|nr:hypothetical protein DSM106972_029710 [Dulcicalothrix desertica PCC 7102]
MLTNSHSPAIQTSPSKFLPPDNAKERVSAFMRQLQDEIANGLEAVDGVAKFQEDSWERPEGGGGRSRVLRTGQYLNKLVSIFRKCGETIYHHQF